MNEPGMRLDLRYEYIRQNQPQTGTRRLAVGEIPRHVFLSPGASYAFTKEVQLYGFLQLPLYQYVNGVQLTAKHAFVVGLNTRF